MATGEHGSLLGASGAVDRVCPFKVEPRLNWYRPGRAKNEGRLKYQGDLRRSAWANMLASGGVQDEINT